MKALFFLLVLSLISTAGAEVSVSINTWIDGDTTSISMDAFNAEVAGWMILMPQGNYSDNMYWYGNTMGFTWHN
jgi:hypothetical protein